MNLLSIARNIIPKPFKPFHFLEIYDNHFSRFENERISILEIGVRTGASLRLWKQAFPNASIIGIDILQSCFFEEDRIKVLIGSQRDEEFLRSVEREYGPFSIIIDDGSHIMRDQLTSFSILFPLLVDKGLYCIEDTNTSFWYKWKDTPGNNFSETTIFALTQYAILPTMWAARNKEATNPSASEKNAFEDVISSVHFYNSICIVQKRGLGYFPGEPTVI